MTTIYKNTCEKCGYTIESTSKPLVYRGMDEIVMTVELRESYEREHEAGVKDRQHFDCMVESYRKTAREANEKYSSVGIFHDVWTQIGYAQLTCDGVIIASCERSAWVPDDTTIEHEYIECEICGYRRIVTTSIVRVDEEE